MRTLTIGRGNFNAVAYTDNGRFLISVNSGRRLRFWSLETFAECLLLTPPDEPRFPGSGFFLSGTLLCLNSRLWDITSALDALRGEMKRPPGLPLTQIPLEESPLLEVPMAATPDGSAVVGKLLAVRRRAAAFARAVVTSYRHLGRVRLWDRHGRRLTEFDANASTIDDLALSPDGKIVATTVLRLVLLFDVATGQRMAALEHSDFTRCLRFSPDGRLLAVAAGRSVWLWDVAERRALKRFDAFSKHVECLAFHPTGRLLGAGSRDGEVRLWRTANLEAAASLDWKVGAVHGLAFSPDGQTAAAAGHDNAIVVWDIDL
jgi:WD40 repeat protein